MNIEIVKFPETQYFVEKYKKTQIYLHHTAGNKFAKNVIDGWVNTPERIATSMVISDTGDVLQSFPSDCWAYHLGIKQEHFKKYNLPFIQLDKYSIGIEICNWGQLTKKENKFYNYLNKEVPSSEVYELKTPFRGFKYYHNYTDSQLSSVKELLLLWNKLYDIPLDYNDDIWDLTPRAYKCSPGVYTHCSVRPDKNDVYPHHKLIEILKSF